jgi:hypothetical protein
VSVPGLLGASCGECMCGVHGGTEEQTEAFVRKHALHKNFSVALDVFGQPERMTWAEYLKRIREANS